MSQEYDIPAVSRHQAEDVIKRSHFITTLSHVQSVEEARAFIAEIKAEHPDATHNCWAFNAGPAGDTAFVGCSDDGEPSGTAGRPMLNVLNHCSVGEIAAVVTRYYGGIKLGTGGLVRAYSGMVQLGLDTLPTKRRFEAASVHIGIEYRHITLFKRMLERHEAEIQEENFGTDAQFMLRLPKRNLETLCAELVEMTDGIARIHVQK